MRYFWPKVELKTLSELLALSKVHFAAIIGFLTKHRPIVPHAVRIHIFRHFILNCPNFVRQRLKYLGRYIFGQPDEDAGFDIGHITTFVVGSKFVVGFVDL